MTLRLVVLACTLLAVRTAAADEAVAPARVLRSPAGQGHSSASWIYRTTTAPPGSTTHYAEYDFGTDTENGYDQLHVEYSTNNVTYNLLHSVSGSRAGHHKVFLPVSGLVYVRFRFAKDSSISVGLDAVWVDNLSFGNQRGRYARHVFSTTTAGATPAGWTSGGTLGGFKAQPPYVGRSVGAPRNQPALTTTSMQQTIAFATNKNNSCRFDYMIDASPSSYLRVWEGATKIFELTGGAKRDGATVQLSNAAGAKTIRFEFVRGSGSAGLNTAKVTNITCRSANLDFATYDYQGRPLAAAPSGWTGACTSQGGSCTGVSGWQVHKVTPHASYVPKQTPALEPVVDGVFKQNEYPNRTELQVRALDGGPVLGRLAMYVSAATGKLYVTARVKSDTPGVVGSETGSVFLYLDDAVQSTLAYVGCAGDAHYPADVDRRIRFDYSLAASASTQVVSIFTQVKGNCAGSWVALGASPYFATTATVTDTGDDRLTIEVSVTLGGGIWAASRLGLGFARTTAALVYRERFPYREDALAAPADADTYSWETVYLTPTPVTGPAPSEAPYDACCFEKENAYQ
jgi:hypothetical protein